MNTSRFVFESKALNLPLFFSLTFALKFYLWQNYITFNIFSVIFLKKLLQFLAVKNLHLWLLLSIFVLSFVLSYENTLRNIIKLSCKAIDQNASIWVLPQRKEIICWRAHIPSCKDQLKSLKSSYWHSSYICQNKVL